MKLLICILILLSHSLESFSEEGELAHVREINVQSTQFEQEHFRIFPKSKIVIQNFNFKEIITNPSKFELFITQNLSIIDIESPKEIEILLSKGSQNFIFSSYFKKTPLLSEFIYRSLKKPEKIAKFSKIFLEFNKLVLFGFIMIFTFLFSHFLGEFKFSYDVLSVQRIVLSITRFSFINFLRLGCLGLLFSENFSPLIEIFAESVKIHEANYPIISFLTHAL